MLTSLFSPTIGDVPRALVAANSNITATTDPGPSNDNTQGYSAGSIWFNVTLNREWTCISAATGAAVWSFGGAAYAQGGSNPAVEVTAFGLGASVMGEEGNLYRIPGPTVPSVPITPGGAGADYVVGAYTMTASSFDVSGRGLNLEGIGSFAANGNTKRIKLYVGATTATVGSAITGGTAIADTGAVATNGGGWTIQATLYKYGAAGSNTQVGLHAPTQVGNAVSTLLAPQLLTLTESAPIIIAITINNTTTATDALLYNFTVNGMN